MTNDPPEEPDDHEDANEAPAQSGRNPPSSRQLEYWLGHFAQFDLLTNLPNRSQFLDRLHGAIARAARSRRVLGVMLLNLDRFRNLNAKYGLRTGDLVLKRMGERLKLCTRASDSIARLGGDEFSVLLEGLVDKGGATIAAQRVQAALARPLAIGADEVAVTATVGVAFHPSDGGTVDELLHCADLAVVHAKRRQRGSCQFYSADIAASLQDDDERQSGVAQRLARLTPREREVLDILVAGNANKMIAYMLGTSTRTIEHHRARIMDKMEARSLPELVRMVLDVHRGGRA